MEQVVSALRGALPLRLKRRKSLHGPSPCMGQTWQLIRAFELRYFKLRSPMET